MSSDLPPRPPLVEPGKVRALRAVFERNVSSAPPISTPADFERTRAMVARHNLKFAARRASRMGLQAAPAKTATMVQDKAEWMTFDNADAFWLPELDAAIESGDDRGVNKAVLKFFFEEHDPTRVQEVDKILEENIGREEALFVELSAKYPEPSMGVAFAMVDAEKKLEDDEQKKDWAVFDDDKPILNGMRRPTGVWAVNYSPWQE